MLLQSLVLHLATCQASEDTDVGTYIEILEQRSSVTFRGLSANSREHICSQKPEALEQSANGNEGSSVSDFF